MYVFVHLRALKGPRVRQGELLENLLTFTTALSTTMEAYQKSSHTICTNSWGSVFFLKSKSIQMAPTIKEKKEKWATWWNVKIWKHQVR